MPEPRVPLGEAQMKYASKPVPDGATFRNGPLLAAWIGILRVCHLLHMPEYPPACWWDEWPEPRVPLGEAQMKYTSKPVPEGAKFCNAPLLAAGIGILIVCHLLPLHPRKTQQAD